MSSGEWSQICPNCQSAYNPFLLHICPGPVYFTLGTESVNQETQRKLDTAVNALKTIIQEAGACCNLFEICKHDSCRSSVFCWFTASEALKELKIELPEVNHKKWHNCCLHKVEGTDLSVCCIEHGSDCKIITDRYKELCSQGMDKNKARNIVLRNGYEEA